MLNLKPVKTRETMAELAKQINKIRECWESDHWKMFFYFLLEEDSEKICHIHHWADTSIYLESLQLLLQLYFSRQEFEIDREIDTFSLSAMPCATLHGVCAKRLPHFDFNFRYLWNDPGFDIRSQDDMPAFLAQSEWATLSRTTLHESVS